jgi:antitoxin YefM
MYAISYICARKNLAQTLNKLCKNYDPVIITQRNNTVVMMSIKDYESLNKTACLLRSPRNARRLMVSIDGLESVKGKERDLVE